MPTLPKIHTSLDSFLTAIHGAFQTVKITASDIQQPVDVQSHYQQTIQTHNAVSVPATTGLSTGAWIDTNGFDTVAVTFKNSTSTASNVYLYFSSDGINEAGWETVGSGTSSTKSGIFETRARYVRVALGNTDAAAKVMSAWIYLKA